MASQPLIPTLLFLFIDDFIEITGLAFSCTMNTFGTRLCGGVFSHADATASTAAAESLCGKFGRTVKRHISKKACTVGVPA